MALKKSRTLTGFEPVISQYRYLVMKPLTLGAGHFAGFQSQWLYSSVGRASHQYREVSVSHPVEVLNFFRFLYAIAYNCVRNCDDQSSFDFIFAVHMIHFIYITHRMKHDKRIHSYTVHFRCPECQHSTKLYWSPSTTG